MNAPVLVSCAASAVPEKRATKPLPDHEKRGAAALVASMRPNQRTPAATTPGPRRSAGIADLSSHRRRCHVRRCGRGAVLRRIARDVSSRVRRGATRADRRRPCRPRRPFRPPSSARRAPAPPAPGCPPAPSPLEDAESPQPATAMTATPTSSAQRALPCRGSRMSGLYHERRAGATRESRQRHIEA